MFDKNWIFLGAAVCFFLAVTEQAQAQKTAFIQPEDEELLEDIFAEKEAAADRKNNVKKGYEDGSGTFIKGILPASKVSAEPLQVQIKEENIPLSTDGNKVMTVEAGAKSSLHQVEENIVNTPVYTEEKIQTISSSNFVSNDDTTGRRDVTSSDAIIISPKNLTDSLPDYSGGAEEIIYMTPQAQERVAARASLEERDNTEHRQSFQKDFADSEDIGTKSYRNRMADCFAQQQSSLELDRALFYQQNRSETTARISQVFAEINGCYEDIGYDIISEYYSGDEEMMQKFANKVPEFYVTGTDVAFNTKFCGEFCSMDAIFNAQTDKFAEFRTYLSQLLAERPKANPSNE